jgi:hypothetical protein
VNLFAAAVALLKDERLLQPDLAVLGENTQVSSWPDRDLTRAVERHPDARRVGAWCDDEVVLEGALVAVVLDVNARVNAVIADPAIRRHVALPAAGIGALEVVDPSGKRFKAFDDRTSLAANERHSQYGRRRD